MTLIGFHPISEKLSSRKAVFWQIFRKNNVRVFRVFRGPKRINLFGEQVRHEIVYPVPHRQYVLTIPKRLRCYFRNNPQLLGQLCLAAQDSLKMFLRNQLGFTSAISDTVFFSDFTFTEEFLD